MPDGQAARKAALELAGKMGFQHPEVVHQQRLTEHHTYFVMYGHTVHAIDYASLSEEGADIVQYMTEEEVDGFLRLPLTMALATVSANGQPHLAAMWYGFVDGSLGFDTVHRRVIPGQLEQLGAAECASCVASKGY